MKLVASPEIFRSLPGELSYAPTPRSAAHRGSTVSRWWSSRRTSPSKAVAIRLPSRPNGSLRHDRTVTGKVGPRKSRTSSRVRVGTNYGKWGIRSALLEDHVHGEADSQLFGEIGQPVSGAPGPDDGDELRGTRHPGRPRRRSSPPPAGGGCPLPVPSTLPDDGGSGDDPASPTRTGSQGGVLPPPPQTVSPAYQRVHHVGGGHLVPPYTFPARSSGSSPELCRRGGLGGVTGPTTNVTGEGIEGGAALPRAPYQERRGGVRAALNASTRRGRPPFFTPPPALPHPTGSSASAAPGKRELSGVQRRSHHHQGAQSPPREGIQAVARPSPSHPGGNQTRIARRRRAMRSPSHIFAEVCHGQVGLTSQTRRGFHPGGPGAYG